MPGKHQKEWTREKGDSIIEENPVPVTGGEGGYYEEGVRDTLHKTGARRSAQCIGGETAGVDEFELISKLEKLTNTTCPKALSDTKNKAVRFTGSIKPEDMAAAVLDFINK